MSNRCVIAALLAVLCSGCGPMPDDDAAAGGVPRANVAGLGAMSGSLRVSAQRVRADDPTTPAPADSKYGCRSVLSAPECHDLSAPVTLTELCPSPDVPSGVWNFRYELFTDAGCSGPLANPDSGFPVKCVDARNLYSRRDLNQTRGEALAAGASKHNAIVCATARLLFAQQPTSTTVGVPISPPVTVQLQDGFGSDLALAGVTVTMSVATGPGAFTPGSITTATTDGSGLATFSTLALNAAGTYTLAASSPGVVGATSGTFVVSPAGSTVLVYSAVGPPAGRKGSGPLLVSYPPATALNDLLLLILINGANQASPTPAGWTQLADQSAQKPQQLRFTLWWRRAGAETNVSMTVNTNSSGATAWVVRYRRPSGYPPLPAPATATVRQGTAGALAMLTPSPNLTTNQPNATVISLVAIRAQNPLSLAVPQGFGLKLATTYQPASVGVGLGIADLVVPGSGTTSPSPTWQQTGTPAQWAWATIAFH